MTYQYMEEKLEELEKRIEALEQEPPKVGPDEYTKYGMWIGEEDDSCDLINRQDAIKAIEKKAKRIKNKDTLNGLAGAVNVLFELPPVTLTKDMKLKLIEANVNGYSQGLKDASNMAQEPIGHCKDCKYFEYDYVANIDGIPLIVAHEFCKRWGDGCKTKEDGYCFLYEPSESEE